MRTSSIRLAGRWQQTQIACPRGWRSLEDKPAEPFLATSTRTVYAEPIDPSVYIHTRVAMLSTYEVKNTQGKSVPEVAAMARFETLTWR